MPPGLPEQAPRRWRWRELLLLALLLVAVAFALLRWRVIRQDRAIRVDLLEVVLQEERVRSAGQPSEARRLVAQGVDSEWERRYLSTFVPSSNRVTQPVEVGLGEVQSDGRTAVVEVIRNGGYPQRRAYTRQGGRWRRSPLTIDEGETQALTSGPVRITYHRPADRAIAEQLVGDIGAAQEEQWASQPPLFQLLPTEFAPAALLFPSGRLPEPIWLNAPDLVEPEGTLDGWQTVRLAVARAMRPVSPDPQPIPQSAPRMRAAMAEVIAMRAVLTPEQYQERVSAWKQVMGEWQSPFFIAGETRGQINPWQPNRIEATSLLAAHALYNQVGAQRLAELVAASYTAQSWDVLFHVELDRYVVQLENEIRAELDLPTVADPLFPEGLPRFPLTATLLRDRQEDYFSPATFTVDVAGDGSTEPVVVDASSARVRFPDGTAATAACLTRYDQFRLWGDWSEPGKAVYATEITLPTTSPPPLEATVAPPDAVAYLYENVRGEANLPFALAALLPDQSQRSLVAGAATRRVYPLLAGYGDPARFLIVEEARDCQQLWFYLYEAGQGIIGGWNTPTNQWSVSYPLWNPQMHAVVVVVFDRSGAYRSFTLTADNAGQIVQPGAEIPGEYQLVGWIPDEGSVVVLHRSVYEIGVLDLATGAFRRLYMQSGAQRITPVVLEGSRLTYIAYESDGRPLPAQQLDLATLPAGPTEFPFPIFPLRLREGHPSMIGVLPEQSQMVIADRATGTIQSVLTDQVGESTSPSVDMPSLCSDSVVLYTLTSPVSVELHRWTPQEGDEILVTSGLGAPSVRYACP